MELVTMWFLLTLVFASLIATSVAFRLGRCVQSFVQCQQPENKIHELFATFRQCRCPGTTKECHRALCVSEIHLLISNMIAASKILVLEGSSCTCRREKGW